MSSTASTTAALEAADPDPRHDLADHEHDEQLDDQADDRDERGHRRQGEQQRGPGERVEHRQGECGEHQCPRPVEGQVAETVATIRSAAIAAR